MKLHEILLDANLLVPNSINDETKVRWLNQDQRQLYRDFGFPDISEPFTAEIDVQLYILPENCSRERITSVIVNGEEYAYVTLEDDLNGNSWTIIEEKLWIHPAPKQDSPAYLNYRPRPSDMRVDMQEEEPDFPSDFHEILVLGIGIRLARAQADTNKAMELKLAKDSLVMEAIRQLKPARQRKVRMTRRWG